MTGRDPIIEFLNSCSVTVDASGTTASILSSREAKKDMINIPLKRFSDKITKELSAETDQ